MGGVYDELGDVYELLEDEEVQEELGLLNDDGVGLIKSKDINILDIKKAFDIYFFLSKLTIYKQIYNLFFKNQI